jgi:hypothetical protein
MPPPVRRYTDELHDDFSYWGTWLPSSRLRVGDCGPVRDRVFSPETTLDRFGIAFEMSRGDKRLDLEHRSQTGVEYRIQASGGNQIIPQIPPGKAGIEISFGQKGGVAFALRGGYENRIDDIHALSAPLMDRIGTGDFPREYAVVTHVVEAESLSVLISGSQNASFVASAKVDLKAGLLDLANAGAGFSRVSGSGVEIEILAERGATPLFKLVGFKKGGWFWGSSRIESLGFEEDEDPGDLDTVDPADTDDEEE